MQFGRVLIFLKMILLHKTKITGVEINFVTTEKIFVYDFFF